MSSIQLLDKTRKINKLLHNNNSQKVVFNDICKVLTEVMDSNVLVVSKKGKILGKNEAEDIEVLQDLTRTLMIIMRSLPRSISQENDSAHCLCIVRTRNILLTILF